MESITNIQFQESPKSNPNHDLDQVVYFAHHDHQHDDLLYFEDIANYLMLDEGFEKGDVSGSGNESVSESRVTDESSSSARIACTMQDLSKKNRRIVKKYNKESQEFRVAFRTKSDLEIMDDGFKWRKYGKKMVKSSPNPRNYFRCSNGGCSVKKRVERERGDSSYVITTYEGVHNHESPTCVLYCTPHSITL